MSPNPFRTANGRFGLTRRQFIAGSSAALLAGGVSVPAEDAAKLALNGGPQSVPSVPKLGRRWGDPERERLNATLQQDTLFYWKGPQTKAFTERFQKVFPARYVMPCSSGTAAL